MIKTESKINKNNYYASETLKAQKINEEYKKLKSCLLKKYIAILIIF